VTTAGSGRSASSGQQGRVLRRSGPRCWCEIQLEASWVSWPRVPIHQLLMQQVEATVLLASQRAPARTLAKVRLNRASTPPAGGGGLAASSSLAASPLRRERQASTRGAGRPGPGPNSNPSPLLAPVDRASGRSDRGCPRWSRASACGALHSRPSHSCRLKFVTVGPIQ